MLGKRHGDHSGHLAPFLLTVMSALGGGSVEAEQIAQRDRCAVPFGALKDLEGHGDGMVMQPLMPIKNGENIQPPAGFGGWMAR